MFRIGLPKLKIPVLILLTFILSACGSAVASPAPRPATVLLTLPGTPFIYYGEEIGMTGRKPDELIRTPMQWSDAEQAGFTEGTPGSRQTAILRKPMWTLS